MTIDHHGERPLFSVVVPTFRRLDALKLVLTAWERQTPTDLPFEVVVVDDGSGDGTADFLVAHRPRRYGWRCASQRNAGPAQARNHALALARGSFVLFTGDDIEPSPTLLAEHWQAHQQSDDPNTVILGLTRWPEDVERTATMRHVDGTGAQQFSYHFLEDGAEYDFRHFYTSNVSLRRSLLDLEPTYFSTDFPSAAFEDAELAYRLAGHGARIIYRRAPLAFHHHPYTAAGFFRRQVRCGAMAEVLHRKQPVLAKFLGIRELAWHRLDALAAPQGDRAAVTAVAEALEDWEARMVRFAGFFDPLDGPHVDDLYLKVFAYGFEKGLAEARLGADQARWVCAWRFFETIPAAVAHAGRLARRRGLPLPEADHATLVSLEG